MNFEEILHLLRTMATNIEPETLVQLKDHLRNEGNAFALAVDERASNHLLQLAQDSMAARQALANAMYHSDAMRALFGKVLLSQVLHERSKEEAQFLRLRLIFLASINLENARVVQSSPDLLFVSINTKANNIELLRIAYNVLRIGDVEVVANWLCLLLEGNGTDRTSKEDLILMGNIFNVLSLLSIHYGKILPRYGPMLMNYFNALMVCGEKVLEAPDRAAFLCSALKFWALVVDSKEYADNVHEGLVAKLENEEPFRNGLIALLHNPRFELLPLTGDLLFKICDNDCTCLFLILIR